jgi:hypothetical protein
VNWLDEVLLQHKELESPLTFWYWAGLAALSAALKDNVWLDRQLYKLYPNIYVMLHAKSGLKKGPPISMAKQLVRAVNNTRIISGRSSIQGILKELGTAYTQPGGVVINKAIAFICSSELTSSIVEDKVATDILTDLYDRHYNEGDWRSLLKAESFKLRDPTITMLTATNESHSEEFFAKKDVQGGYFARTFIIYADRENTINSLINPLENPPDYKKLAEYIKKISNLQGAFKSLYQTQAGDFYNEWYDGFARARGEIDDETGTLNRFGDSVLKVAMLISLAREPDLEISLEAMQEAVIQCEKLIGYARRVTMGRKGKSSYAGQKVMILEKLLKREPHQITRAQLLRDMQYHLNAGELDEIMRGYDEDGSIKQERHGSQWVYVMSDVFATQIEEWFKGRNKK